MRLDGDVYVGEGHMGCLVAGQPTSYSFLPSFLPSSVFFSFLFFSPFLPPSHWCLAFPYLGMASPCLCLTCQSGKAVLSRHASPRLAALITMIFSPPCLYITMCLSQHLEELLFKCVYIVLSPPHMQFYLPCLQNASMFVEANKDT
jgi:hypothetical protein